ncbi:hypothetical protein PPL_00968 [Heterostelium album PN500]|uniref:THH1/TOM1/TOM3 domain-containing protein n=1 Tax=Heterostelium pallidum (strain ATCC 26659 / Pp 5 / PN500) TaxID=670386 RepID=D3AXR1_HETP5|nr:hypothetical protein PPL_00968 [Heterostelium album PN500]EFA85738.1 hypothetical protein PPL_00968 [Heterostelium album PN500]|eukprot:XP_020437844.1 hypothetical protein PPL_00968 [Heterostelium album PN500]
MSNNSNSTFFCLDHSQCGDLGRCVNGTCICRSYLQGPQCETSYSSVLGRSFTIFRLVFLLSIIYFAVDPWATLGIFPFPLSMFLYHFPLYILFTSYQMLLLYWSGTYHNVATLENGRLFIDKTKPVFIIANVLWLVLEITEIVAVAINNRSDTNFTFYKYVTYFYNIYIALCCIGLTVGFSVYGTLLYKRISSLPTNKDKKRKTLRKLLISTVVLAFSTAIVTIPSIILYFSKLTKGPSGALLYVSFIHGIECFLVMELFWIMKPRETMPFAANTPGYYDNNQIYLEKCPTDHKPKDDYYLSPKKTLFFSTK